MEALVAAVDAAGQRAHRRIPIVIDGLNEAEDPRKWKSELASLNRLLGSYAYVLVICTVRTAFANEALPQELARIEISDFGHDSVEAIRRYFNYYRISASDAELPIGLLKHPLTLRLFCEVTNTSRKKIVGIESMPQSLTALFDRYLSQAAERIAELAPLSHRYYEQDVRSALGEIGNMLWQHKTRSIDLRDLRDQLQDSERPWNASMSRDYARRILQIAQLHNPFLLTKTERSPTVPPFKDGGIRNWDTLSDPAKQQYRAGNAPLGMDFENYTIGRLVPSRHNYDYENEEYKLVVGQITWRIYQLGYSLEAFGEIDKAIANTRYFGRSERPSIERYGKKYGRIAYFELYGLREDQGLMRREWRDSEDRSIDAYIDPSFPDGPRKITLLSDFLGPRSTHISQWIKKGPTPSVRPLLVRATVDQKPGPWVLLNGYCSQEDKSAERVGFVMIRSLVLLREDLTEFTRLIRKDANTNWSRPDIRQEETTFAGEVPWCDTFRHTELSTLDSVVGKQRVPVSPADLRYKLRLVFNSGGVEDTVSLPKPPEFEEVDIRRRIAAYLPMRRTSFTSAAGIDRPSVDCAVERNRRALRIVDEHPQL